MNDNADLPQPNALDRFPSPAFRQLCARHPDKLSHIRNQILEKAPEKMPAEYTLLLGGIETTERFLDLLSQQEAHEEVSEGERVTGMFRASYEQVLFELDTAIGFFSAADTDIMTDTQKDNAYRLAAQTHALALVAHFTMVRTLGSDQEFIDSMGHADQSQVLDVIRTFSGAFPHSIHTKEILVAGLVSQMLDQQKDITDEERRVWLEKFYHHVVKDLDVYDPKTAEVYADSTREPRRMANALISLFKEGKIPKDWTYLSFGCGDGNRVDEKVFEIIKDEFPDAMPGRIIGVDMMDQKEGAFYKKATLDGADIPIQFVQGTIEDIDTPQLKELIGQVDVVAGIGSPLNNQNLLRVHMWRYWPSIAKLLKNGGIAMYEVGFAEPGGDANERMQRMLSDYHEFNKIFGEIGILPAYKRPDDKIGETGAYIYPWQILELIVNESGLQFFTDRDQIAALHQRYQDPRQLYDDTKDGSVDDPLKFPFYWANAPQDYDSTKPANIRGLVIMKKVREPEAGLIRLLLSGEDR